MKTDEWDKIGRVLINAARNLENAGADFIFLCTNTMYKLFEQIDWNEYCGNGKGYTFKKVSDIKGMAGFHLFGIAADDCPFCVAAVYWET
jgi:hypothetical protein